MWKLGDLLTPEQLQMLERYKMSDVIAVVDDQSRTILVKPKYTKLIQSIAKQYPNYQIIVSDFTPDTEKLKCIYNDEL